MSLRLDKKQWAVTIIGFLALLGLLFLLYYLLVKPVQTEVQQKETELETEQKLLAIIQERINNIGDESFESTVSLQKRIPVKPMADQLVLDLEKAETVSGAFIKEINFTKESVVFPRQEEQTNEDSAADEEDVETPVENAPPRTEAALLPEGMEKISAAVVVEARDYEEFEEFLNVLESLVRIVQVDEVVVHGPNELVALDDETSVFTFEAIISAFYLPVLEDLLDQLPQIDAPDPAHKRNPFNRLPNQQSTDDEE